jgi:hypothetical protein
VSPQGGSIAVHVDSDLDAAEAMALTVEPSECPPAPTSQPFALATLA